ncbi:hypothetical protein MMC14_005806 [Varicellaria rhodocarpa]|nr:hypothetical protein [Varicellaria rhodocarpa]
MRFSQTLAGLILVGSSTVLGLAVHFPRESPQEVQEAEDQYEQELGDPTPPPSPAPAHPRASFSTPAAGTAPK